MNNDMTVRRVRSLIAAEWRHHRFIFHLYVHPFKKVLFYKQVITIYPSNNLLHRGAHREYGICGYKFSIF